MRSKTDIFIALLAEYMKLARDNGNDFRPMEEIDKEEIEWADEYNQAKE